MAVKTETTFGTLYFDHMEERNEDKVLLKYFSNVFNPLGRTRFSDRNRLRIGKVD